MKTKYSFFIHIMIVFSIIFILTSFKGKKDVVIKKDPLITHGCNNAVSVYAQGPGLTITSVQITAGGNSASYPVNLASGQTATFYSPYYTSGKIISVTIGANPSGTGFKSIGTENPGKCTSFSKQIFAASISQTQPCDGLVVEGATTTGCS